MKSAAFNQFLPWILPLILLAAWQGLSSAGILASFIFSGYSHLEEAYRVAELLFPLLEAGSQSAETSPQYLSPFGEVSASLAEQDGRRRYASAPREGDIASFGSE